MAIKFSELDRWALERQALVNSAPSGWRIVKLRQLLRQKQDKVTVKNDTSYRLYGVKWYGEGVFERETCLGAEVSASYLYPLRGGCLIYNRLFAWKASFAVVPENAGSAYVSNEFPQFEVDKQQAHPQYVLLYCLSAPFVEAVKKASEGSAAVSRNRFKEASFLDFEMPLPPLNIQHAIVTQWEQAQAEVQRAEARAAERESQVQADFLAALGLSAPAQPQGRRRAFALNFSAMERWGVESNRLALGAGSVAQVHFPIIEGNECIASVSHGCSASPSLQPTALEVLKISAVTKGWLDVSEKKFAPDTQRLREAFSLQRGDVLLCRTNGTLAYVGSAALVEDDLADMIFPDKVIRVRLKANVLPAFFWQVLKTPFLRAQIESFARTAVGNYAMGGKDVWKLRLPLPPLDIQKALVEAIAQARAEAAQWRTRAAQVREQARLALERALLGAPGENS